MDSDRQSAPLRTFASLREDLRRERRVFTTVIVLLVCATIAAAAVAIRTRILTSLREEAQIALLYDRLLADRILDRHSALTVAALLATRHVNSPLPEQPLAAGGRCVLSATARGDSALKAACDEIAGVLSSSADGPPFEIVRISDGSAYVHQPAGDPHAPPHADPALVHHVLARFSHARLDPAAAARDKHVLWFSAPSIGQQTNEMIGATIVARDDTPYAIVLTNLDLAEISAATRPGSREPRPLLLDNEGRLAVGTSSRAEIERIDAQLTDRADGVYHWIPSYGWALRRTAPLSGFGDMLCLLPYRLQLAALRNELLLIVAVAAALIVLLLSTYRYWNYRFLGRIYSQANRALETEMLNHLLVHATPVGLCIVRREALEIVVANPIVRHVLGLGPNDTRLPDALRQEFETRGTPDAAEGETVISQFSFAMKRAPNDDVHLEITYAAATLDREDVYFCAMTDITARHRAEQILLEAKRTAEDTAKSKVAFFASMSHELRTPLASLVGNIELIELGPLAPEQRERVRAMQSSAQGLLQIVNDVLDFSKIDVGELTLAEQSGSLTDLLDRIAMQHAPLAVDKALRFYVVIDRELPAQLCFDPVRVAQIVDNLLSNAFKFTESGKVVLRAQWVDERVQITVVDSGCGIPPELRERLFRPFTQGDVSRLAQARGTGLGLSICARLATLMGGSIEVDSTVGVGTRVAVLLPLQAPVAAPPALAWTLPWRRPALLCRAPEYREWLTSLFDPDQSTITAAHEMGERPDPASYDFLIVTDEFVEAKVLAWWRNPRTIVWVRQAGPLVPARRRDGGVEVSVYSLSGLRAATQAAVDGARGTARDEVDGGASAVSRAQRSASRRATEPQTEPATEPATQTETEPATQAETGRDGPLTVLIAEDNLLNRNLLRDQLKTLGARVIEATRGDEALAWFDRQAVDAVFTDINMPGMHGYDLLDRLRARQPWLPVFAISASARQEDIAQGRARGFTDYLTKPVALAALADALRTAAALVRRDTPLAGAPPATPLQDGEAPLDEPLHGEAPHRGDATPDLPVLPPAFVQPFQQQTRADLAELADIVAERSVTRLRQWLHRVSGGLSVLGRSKLLEQCQQLREKAARARSWNEDLEQASLAIGDVLEAMQSLSARPEDAPR